jgi:hypothetical protein
MHGYQHRVSTSNPTGSGGVRHRRKGDRCERELVQRHRALGIHAKCVSPSSGVARYRCNRIDIDAHDRDECLLVAEMKARRNDAGFPMLQAWLFGAELLFLRRDRDDPLVVMPWRTWAALLQRVRR